MYRKVFITGCAKSGTTLLWQLCYAFKDVYVYDEDSESSLKAFLRYNYDGDNSYVVGKRNAKTIFSNVLVGSGAARIQYKKIKRNNIHIINIVRDGRDVVVSGKKKSLSSTPYVDPKRWIASMKHRRKYGDVIDVEVRYEELVSSPDKVQQQIASAMGWEYDDLFSDFPSFVSPKATTHANNKIKASITRSLVNKNKNAYKDICDSKVLKEFEAELDLLGYK